MIDVAKISSKADNQGKNQEGWEKQALVKEINGRKETAQRIDGKPFLFFPKVFHFLTFILFPPLFIDQKAP